MEWSIHQIARQAGTTSRALRHYGQLGLLPASRVGASGYRYYDQASLLRLQQILLLRDLGLSLAAIGTVLDARDGDPAPALQGHLRWLEREHARIGRQITAVQTTLDKTRRGEPLMPAEIFDGFDHTQYRDEVAQRWGTAAADHSDRWWGQLTAADKATFQQTQRDIAAAFTAAHRAGQPATDPAVQQLAARHAAWLATATGAPVTGAYLRGLADMYLTDPRFAANYGQPGDGTVALVRDALHTYADTISAD